MGLSTLSTSTRFGLLVFAGWSVAVLVGAALSHAFAWDATGNALYSIATRAAVWVGLAWWIWIRRRQLPRRAIGFDRPGRGIAIGGAIGAGVILFSVFLDWFFGGASLYIPLLGLELVNTVLVIPAIEEIALRGYFFASVRQEGFSVDSAIWRSGLLFVALYIPGWYLSGRLRAPLSALQPAIFLLLLGLFLGWIRERTESLWVCIVVHVMNNLYAAFRG